MRIRTVLYAALAVAGAAMAVGLPVAIHRSGSADFPLWIKAASPGSLSAAHAFLSQQCESCHTPTKGVEAAACLTCHATAAPDLMTKLSTAFHGDIGECAGCHVEHQGRDRRPINMDHAVLVTAGHAKAVGQAPSSSQQEDDARFRHVLALLESQLAGSASDLAPNSMTSRGLPAGELAALDCAGCHATRDRHRTLFGRECQGCHNVDTWSIASFRHPSPRSQDCVECHQAPPSHYMMHFTMMDQMITGQTNARVQQCFLCHQTDAWNNIRGVGWFKHH